VIHLRNLHPKRTLAVPLDDAWYRVLRPNVTSMLPAEALHFPAVRQLLAQQLVTVVDAVQCDADARQARAVRLDMAKLVAIAEQAEFDRLLQGVRLRGSYRSPGVPRKRRADEWPEEWTARLKQRWAEGATGPEIAAELGGNVTPGSVGAKIRRLGLASRYARRSN
jgi:hypothetical protein